MFTPAVVFRRLSDGSHKTILPGGIIGRLHTAEIVVDHALVSEAHAMVSLRAEGLMLLALRGRLGLDGRIFTDIVLRRNQRIDLLQGQGAVAGESLVVETIEAPDEILALEHEGHVVADLFGGDLWLSTQAHRGREGLFVSRRPVEGALARIQIAGTRWTLHLEGQRPRALEPGVAFKVGAVRIDVISKAPPICAATRGGLTPVAPLCLRFDGALARIRVGPEERLVLGGRPFELLLALHGMRPSPWHEVAARIWPRTDRGPLRDRWDKTLHSLRDALRDAGVDRVTVEDDAGDADDRRALVRSVAGLWSLNLLPGDRVEVV